MDPTAYPHVLLEAVTSDTHEGPQIARSGDQSPPSDLHGAQPKRLLALVEDPGDTVRDDEQMA